MSTVRSDIKDLDSAEGAVRCFRPRGGIKGAEYVEEPGAPPLFPSAVLPGFRFDLTPILAFVAQQGA